jgi:hypothetical protein
MKFIIWSFDYSKKWGGVIVLHEFGRILSEMGYEVNLIANNTIPYSNCNLISKERAVELVNLDSNYFIIYPEVVVGNPIGAKKVIRWILYHPGVNGGERKYNKDEIIFTYNSFFVRKTEYENSPVLFVFQSNKNFFKNLKKERNGICYLVKKGSYKNIKIDGYNIDNLLHGNNIDDKILDVFNSFKTFISLDHASYHSVQAALCGCISIVIPENGVSKEEWIEKMPLMRYGIAYGFDDINWAIETQKLVFDNIEKLEKESIKSINDFFKIIKNKFIN